MWLSTTVDNSVYSNTPAGIAALLAAGPTNAGAISNPSSGVYQSSFGLTGVNFPLANDYLYLIWDLRETTNSQLCYSTVDAADACCNCSPVCHSTWFGPLRNDEFSVCTTDTNSPGHAQNSWHGSIGDSIL